MQRLVIHFNAGNGVPFCRNTIHPRGRIPRVTLDKAKVTCLKCLHVAPIPSRPATVPTEKPTND